MAILIRVLLCGALLLEVSAVDGATATAVADFYVATNGNDTWSGRLSAPLRDGTDGPFATMERARDAVRERADRDVTVLVRGGTYRLTNTVVFSLCDSAGEGRTNTYAAFPNETPVFSSAIPITGWRRPKQSPPGLPAAARAHVWVADVKEHPAMKPVADGRSPRFFTLFDDGHRVPRARGKGFSQTNLTPKGSQDYTTVQFPPGAVRHYANPRDAELVIIPTYFWTMNILPIAAIDEETLTLETAQPGTYPLGKNGMDDRPTAWIENVLEVLDEPGEWVLDASGRRLYYWPRDGRPEDVAAPALTELMRVEGSIDYDGPTDQPVRGLVFRGLTFSGGDRLPWHGRTGWGLQHDWERFDKPTALLRLRGAERCRVEECVFKDSGHTALRLDLYCRDNAVVGNQIHDMGGVGVLLAGYGPGTKDVNRGNTVRNNHIHHVGQVYWGSAAIFAWQSGENRIAHNLIHHVPYNGINVTGRINYRTPPGPGECSRTVRWNETPEAFKQWGWREREPYLHARKNVVEYNDIHHAMEVLGDGNCIYVSGCGGGNVVRHNFCHDCSGKYMNAVIRCDDDQNETLISHNVCARTRGAGEGFISKGDNDIINNVVADLRPNNRHRGYIVFPRSSVKGSVIERNILFSCRRDQRLYWQNMHTVRGGPARLRDTQADRNLYYCTADPSWGEAHLRAERQYGIEANSRVGDPLFRDIDANDFRFQPGSPAAALGIEPIDVSEAGLSSVSGSAVELTLNAGNEASARSPQPLSINSRVDPILPAMPRYRVETKGFKASEQDIRAVCDATGRELWRYFPNCRIEPFVVQHGDAGPIVLHRRNDRGEIAVRLDTGSTYWCQYAYQFAHEFCHILCGFREQYQGNQWFEETLCETASLYAMRAMADTWQRDPPYEHWRDFHKAIRSYVADVIASRDKVTDIRRGGLGVFLRGYAEELRRNPTQRDVEGAMSVVLLDLFEQSPASWESVRWLNRSRAPDGESFQHYLQRWHDSAPARHKAFIRRVAELYEVPIATAPGNS